jgi:hypothetical protein
LAATGSSQDAFDGRESALANATLFGEDLKLGPSPGFARN